MPENSSQGRGGRRGLCWRQRGDIKDDSPEARWLAERLALAGHDIIVVSALFGSWGQRGIMPLYSLSNKGGAVLYQCRCRRGRQTGKLSKIVRKCTEERK